MSTRRLRMFAGPNGSGKSTIKVKVAGMNPSWLGVYINPDDVESSIAERGHLAFDEFKIKANASQVFKALRASSLLKEKQLLPAIEKMVFLDNKLSFESVSLNSYFVSAIADFLHESLVAIKTSFSFETVMSHPNKIRLLKKARSNGFRNYLYFVATEDPEINVERVLYRVKTGGHGVPKDKIVDRYYRSLENLLPAIRSTDRAYIFDNSGSKATLIAEITNGKSIEIKNSNVPVWFQRYLLDKVS